MGPAVAIYDPKGQAAASVYQTFTSAAYLERFSKVVAICPCHPQKLSGLSNPKAAAYVPGVYECTCRPDFRTALKGVEVLVYLGTHQDSDFDNTLLDVLVELGTIKMYLLPYFGSEDPMDDFNRPAQRYTYKAIRQRLPQIKVCEILAGLPMERALQQCHGFNFAMGICETVGPPSYEIALTSVNDFSRSLAELALMPHDTIPTAIRLCGETTTLSRFAAHVQTTNEKHIYMVAIDFAILERRTKDRQAELRQRERHLKTGISDYHNRLAQSYTQEARLRQTTTHISSLRTAGWPFGRQADRNAEEARRIEEHRCREREVFENFVDMETRLLDKLRSRWQMDRLKLRLAKGSLDFRLQALGNHNQLVNPDERRWKWQTLEEVITVQQGYHEAVGRSRSSSNDTSSVVPRSETLREMISDFGSLTVRP